jgi:hypothetical protein
MIKTLSSGKNKPFFDNNDAFLKKGSSQQARQQKYTCGGYERMTSW